MSENCDLDDVLLVVQWYTVYGQAYIFLYYLHYNFIIIEKAMESIKTSLCIVYNSSVIVTAGPTILFFQENAGSILYILILISFYVWSKYFFFE